jgi:hypothetical protein
LSSTLPPQLRGLGPEGPAPNPTESSARQFVQAIKNKLSQADAPTARPDRCCGDQTGFALLSVPRRALTLALESGASPAASQLSFRQSFQAIRSKAFARRTLRMPVLIVAGAPSPDFTLSSVSSRNSRWRWNRGLLLQRAHRAFGKAYRRSRTSLSQADAPTTCPDRRWRSWSGFRLVIGVEREVTLALESEPSAAASQSSARQSF